MYYKIRESIRKSGCGHAISCNNFTVMWCKGVPISSYIIRYFVVVAYFRWRAFFCMFLCILFVFCVKNRRGHPRCCENLVNVVSVNEGNLCIVMEKMYGDLKRELSHPDVFKDKPLWELME